MDSKWRTIECDGCDQCLTLLDDEDKEYQVCTWGVKPKKLIEPKKKRHCSLISDPPREKKLGTWKL